MYHLNVQLTAKAAEDCPKIADALRRAGAKSKLEPGCERWEAYQSDSDPKSFLLVEWWTTKEDWEVHRTGEAVTQIYLKEVIPLVERSPHPSQRLC